jgi:hypothetical protein
LRAPAFERELRTERLVPDIRRPQQGVTAREFSTEKRSSLSMFVQRIVWNVG